MTCCSRKVTDTKQTAFQAEDFTDLASIYDFLYAVDPKDGSALYYKGEVHRLLRKRYLMRENFHLYINNAPPPGAELPGVAVLGYFDERTAWIHHLLANDFLCEALMMDDPNARGEPLKHVKEHAEQERKYRMDGFIRGETTLSTDTLERAIRNGIDTIPRPECPEMS